VQYLTAAIILITATASFTGCNKSDDLSHLYPDSTIVVKYQDDYQRGQFHKRVKEFKKNPIGYNKIVFFGNSITYGMRHWDSKFQTNNIVNRGISGDFTQGISKRLDEIIYYRPVSIFILIGINDLFRDNTLRPEVTPSYIAKNILDAAKTIKNGTPETKIYLQTILPINNRHNLMSRTEDIRPNYYFLKSDFHPSINQLINETNKILIKNNEYDVIDLHSLFLNDNGEMNTSLSDDGIHLNENGYSIWIDKVKPLIDNINAAN
jgi:lysophospholipase L1-like esterase